MDSKIHILNWNTSSCNIVSFSEGFFCNFPSNQKELPHSVTKFFSQQNHKIPNTKPRISSFLLLFETIFQIYDQRTVDWKSTYLWWVSAIPIKLREWLNARAKEKASSKVISDNSDASCLSSISAVSSIPAILILQALCTKRKKTKTIHPIRHVNFITTHIHLSHQYHFTED